jgi:hypothetical protein
MDNHSLPAGPSALVEALQVNVPEPFSEICSVDVVEAAFPSRELIPAGVTLKTAPTETGVIWRTTLSASSEK